MATETTRRKTRTAVGTAKTETPPDSVHVMRRHEAGQQLHNPLRMGTALERVPEPCVLVVFGATGDLTSRKILPPVYNLRRSGLLPAETTVLGFSRRPLSDDDFRKQMADSCANFSRVKVEPGLWQDFAEGVFYQQGDFADRSAYKDLAERLEQI